MNTIEAAVELTRLWAERKNPPATPEELSKTYTILFNTIQYPIEKEEKAKNSSGTAL